MDVPQENILGEQLPVEKPTDKPEEKPEDKPEEKPAEETVETLKEKLAKLTTDFEGLNNTNKSKDENIRSMGDKIRQLEKDLKSGGKKEGEGTGPFKEIKRSTDLPKEEREKLTPTEIALMDQLATTQEAMNKVFERLEKGDESKPSIDPATTVKDLAKELAGGNREMANQIIEAFNTLKFDLTGLSEEEILKRVEIAAKNVPNYVPPKQQPTGTGGPAKDTKAVTTVDTSKEHEAHQKNLSGDYAL